MHPSWERIHRHRMRREFEAALCTQKNDASTALRSTILAGLQKIVPYLIARVARLRCTKGR